MCRTDLSLSKKVSNFDQINPTINTGEESEIVRYKYSNSRVGNCMSFCFSFTNTVINIERRSRMTLCVTTQNDVGVD